MMRQSLRRVTGSFQVSAVVIATLAIGVGASATLLGVFRALVWQPIHLPQSSGPRQAIVSLIASTTARSDRRSRWKEIHPVIPHIAASVRLTLRDCTIHKPGAYRG